MIALLQSAPAGGVSITLTGVIALVLAIIALAGHVASGIYFLVRWNTMVQVMKAEVGHVNSELTGFRLEVRESLTAIREDLGALEEKADQVIDLRARIDGLLERVRRVEDDQRSRK